MKKNNYLSMFSLVMLITVSVDSIRNLPISARFGSTLIFFFIVAAVTFLLPTGLIAAELTASHTESSGIYGWVKKAFGKNTGFIAIWLQWVNTLVWYPTTLAFIASALLANLTPELANNRGVITSLIIIIFWAVTLLNLRGFKTSARFAGLLAIFGLIIPLALVITLTAVWLQQNNMPHIHLKLPTLSSLSTIQSWVPMVAIVTSLLGMELASVHVKSIKQPEKTMPKAIVLSAVIIIATMLLGSLAIAATIPGKEISLAAGVMQEFHYLLHYFHVPWLEPILSLLIIVGGLASMINWIISPAEGLIQSAKDEYLPRFFAHRNKHGTASRLLITQAVVVSITSLAFELLPNINASYWLLTALSTELYISMYILMFCAAIYLYLKTKKVSPLMNNIGGKWTLITLCILGLCSCTITLIIGAFPPTNLYHGNLRQYHWLFSLGLIMMLAPITLGYINKAITQKKQSQKD